MPISAPSMSTSARQVLRETTTEVDAQGLPRFSQVRGVSKLCPSKPIGHLILPGHSHGTSQRKPNCRSRSRLRKGSPSYGSGLTSWPAKSPCTQGAHDIVNKIPRYLWELVLHMCFSYKCARGVASWGWHTGGQRVEHDTTFHNALPHTLVGPYVSHRSG